jgi:hypothetical protein
LFKLEEAGVDVMGFDDESVSISGAGNVQPKRVLLGVLATWGGVWAWAAMFLFARVGAGACNLLGVKFGLFGSLPFSPIAWNFSWVASLPGPFILVRETSLYNVMTFWRGRGLVTLCTEGRKVPRSSRVRPEMIWQESPTDDLRGNIRVAGFTWGCGPRCGCGELLVEYLGEVVKSEEPRVPRFTP